MRRAKVSSELLELQLQASRYVPVAVCQSLCADGQSPLDWQLYWKQTLEVRNKLARSQPIQRGSNQASFAPSTQLLLCCYTKHNKVNKLKMFELRGKVRLAFALFALLSCLLLLA